MLIDELIKVESQNALESSVYWKAFVNNKEGQLVLNELCSLYWTVDTFKKDASSDTNAYFHGQRSVITHILRALAQSQQKEMVNE